MHSHLKNPCAAPKRGHHIWSPSTLLVTEVSSLKTRSRNGTVLKGNSILSSWLKLELEHAVVYADPEHPKHAQWVTCLVSMLAMQELGCFQLPVIVYRFLQHGAVHYHAATWGDGLRWMVQQWASGSRHGISVPKFHQLNAPVFLVHNIRMSIP